MLRLLVRMEPRKILLYDLVEDPDLASEAPETVIEWVPLDRLLAESDVLTVHLPMTSDTRGLIGEKELYCLKPDAVVVNTSRGGIVDEEDLHAVLISGHL
ncbi:MAG: NAD(P)-dependent oxidoreductase, partial [Candidatus Thalassarchaeaceae archaeon]|nr:NAD(P)-dependent oxidoreductase [Candidatus Thalassarchaeaceae archaeon]